MCSGESNCPTNFGSTLAAKDSLIKHHLKEWQPGKFVPDVFERDMFFFMLLQFSALKMVTWQFPMSKWFGWKFLEGNAQLSSNF